MPRPTRSRLQFWQDPTDGRWYWWHVNSRDVPGPTSAPYRNRRDVRRGALRRHPGLRLELVDGA